MTAPRTAPRRWIVVAESPFIPTHGGGEREHLGFVQAAVAAGRLATLVVPIDRDPAAVGRDDDLAAIADLVHPAQVVFTPRLRSPFQALSRLPYVVASRPAPAGLVGQVRAAAPDADAVVVFAYKSHELGRVLATALDLPAVIRFHNLEGVYCRSLAAAATAPKSWAIGIEARRVERDERALERADWVSGIADISAADADVRRSRAAVPVDYVPSFALGPRDPAADPASADRRRSPEPTVLFLGALDVSTNHDAIRWFSEAVWPLVRSAVPDARWQIVGRRPTDDVRTLAADTPGVELSADVPDPGVHLRAAHLAVNPAVSGSGVNIKLVEYLASGTPVVSTTRGMAGLGLAPGSDLLVADDAVGFATAVVELLGDPQSADRFGRTGRATAERILDVDAGLDQIGRLLCA